MLLSSGRRRTNKNNNKSQLYDVVPVARDISVLPGPDEATKNAITLIDESTTTTATSTSITTNNKGEGEEEKQEAQAKIDIATNIFFNEAERDANRLNYPKGTPDGFYVTEQYTVPFEGFSTLATGATTMKNNKTNNGIITTDVIERLQINEKNVTVPIALMLFDIETYPSLSRARKYCRKGYIVVHRGPLVLNEETGKYDDFTTSEKCFRARVGDRIYPGDVLGIQCRMRGGYYPGFETATKPPFELPVVYEDDHFAVVNKPAGIVCFSTRNDQQLYGCMTVRSCLPFVLKPPQRGTEAIIRRPVPCHRLDKPTSGLLLIAKTKPAMVDLSKQFEERRIKKTYIAILNGLPQEPTETSITTAEAISLGVDAVNEDDDGSHNCNWQLIDHALEEKSAVTVWRSVKYVKSSRANDGVLTLVEMKPKTGRHHQLRRHMCWVQDCPIVGDLRYDGGGDDAKSLRGRGLFLCSNKVKVEHPYYNTKKGRAVWNGLSDDDDHKTKYGPNDEVRLSDDGSVVEVHVSIDLPNKFETFLASEERGAAWEENNLRRE